MFAKLKYLLYAPKIHGAELFSSPEGELRINLTTVERVKGEFQQLNNFPAIPIYEMLDVWRHTPFSISINTAQLIKRKVVVDVPKEQTLDSVLPNANMQHFYIEEVPISDAEKWVFIIRNEKIKEYISLFEEMGFDVVNIMLGTTAQNYIADSSLSKASSIAYWHRPIGEGLAKNKANEAKHKQLFKYGVRGTGIIFFISLLINFLLFTYYTEATNQLSSELLTYQAERQEMNVLVEEINKQQSLLNEVGEQNKYELSYYADRIAETIPTSLSLQQWVIQPEYPKQKGVFRKGVLLIKGNASAKLLSAWIKELSTIDFIESVSIEGFKQESKVGDFEIKVLIHDS
jgi:hypothetical protein